jgi:hypothetical protein
MLIDNQQFRIKAKIQNPTYFKEQCGLVIYEYSRNAKLMYETKTLTSQFATAKITVSNGAALFHWGLTQTAAVTYGSSSTLVGCERGIYISTALRIVYNSVKLPFTLATATPSGNNLVVRIGINGGAVMDGSIFTNLPAVSG